MLGTLSAFRGTHTESMYLQEAGKYTPQEANEWGKRKGVVRYHKKELTRRSLMLEQPLVLCLL